MNLPTILLVGAGGHAQSCIDVVEREGCFHIAGLIGLPREAGTRVLGYQVLGTDADLQVLHGQIQTAIVTVGQIKTAEPRIRIFRQLEEIGFAMPAIVSPHAYVSPHAQIGPGSIVMHVAIVNAGAVVGRNCIINSNALVEHGARIADHCHIATAAVVNGEANVGEGTFVGSGATVRELVNVGKNCVIGMGQMVLADCPDGCRLPVARGLA